MDGFFFVFVFFFSVLRYIRKLPNNSAKDGPFCALKPSMVPPIRPGWKSVPTSDSDFTLHSPNSNFRGAWCSVMAYRISSPAFHVDLSSLRCQVNCEGAEAYSILTGIARTLVP